jgi:hypothetical protein
MATISECRYRWLRLLDLNLPQFTLKGWLHVWGLPSQPIKSRLVEKRRDGAKEVLGFRLAEHEVHTVVAGRPESGEMCNSADGAGLVLLTLSSDIFRCEEYASLITFEHFLIESSIGE